jgi:preprotein translocase subunit YajC
MPPEVVQAATEPALTTLAQTVLGALLVITVIVAILAIYVLVRVQNARVQDQKEMSDKLEVTHSKMIDAFSGFQGALTSLEKTESTGQAVMQAMRDQLVNLASKVEACPRR